MIIKVLKQSDLAAIDIEQDKKKISYVLSRQCLYECVQDIDSSITYESAIEIKDHLCLKNHPDIVVSLSHTNEFACAIAAKNIEYQSVGIDSENSSRVMNGKSKKYFINPKDDNQEDLLKSWTQKEAAFKAVSPLDHLHKENKDVLVLSDIFIKNDLIYLNWNENPIGKIHTYSYENFLISYALID